MTHLNRIPFFLLLSAACSLALAQQDGTESRLQLHGFGTLGAETSSTDFGGTFARDASQVPGTTGLQFQPDSRLGVQANLPLNDQFELVGQAVLKERPSTAKKSDYIEWAFLSYKPKPDWNLRVGRTGADLFLMSDHKNVGYAYQPARPPVDFYGLLSLNALDGVDIAKSWQVNDTTWKLKGFAGSSSFEVDNRRGQFSDAFGLTLSRETEGLLIRGTVARARLDMSSIDGVALATQGLSQLSNLPIPAVAQQAKDLMADFDLANIRARYVSFGLNYDRNNWVLAAEWMRTYASSAIAAGTAAYVTVGHRFGNLTPYVTFSRSRAGEDQPLATPQWGQALSPYAPILGPAAAPQAQLLGESVVDLLNSSRIDQRTQSIGVRWEINDQTSLKFQHDLVTVGPVGTALWHGQASGGRARVTSVVMEFVF